MFEITVAGRRNADGEIDVMMVEAGATPGGVRLVAEGDAPSDEAAVVEGLAKAKTVISESIDLQLELAELVDIPTVDWPAAPVLSARGGGAGGEGRRTGAVGIGHDGRPAPAFR